MHNLIPAFATPIYYEKNFYKATQEEVKYFDDLPKHKGENIACITDSREILDHEQLQNIKTLMLKRVYEYLENVYRIPLDQYEILVTSSWGTVNERGDQHKKHTHPHTMVSAVYYMQSESGDLSFFQDKNSLQKDYNFQYDFKDYNIFNSNKWTIPVRKGDLCIFPSSVPHSSEPNESDVARKIIGLNVWLKGKIGRYEDLTLLEV